MKYLFEEPMRWREVLSKKDVFVFCDFDGTLTPIRSHPQAAMLASSVRASLEVLQRRPGIRLGVISGRCVKDLKRKVAVKDIFYAGNHGLEAEGPGVDFQAALPEKWFQVLKEIKTMTRTWRRSFEGLHFEDKRLSFSFHYRNVRPRDQGLCRETIAADISRRFGKMDLKIRFGKKVVEVRPPVEWGKGDIVFWLLKTAGAGHYPVYLGDDDTDEDAFHAIGRKGLTIHVGSKDSRAAYGVRNPADVHRFLKCLIALRKT